MFTSTLVIAIAMVATAADPVENARVAYTTCMAKEHNNAIDSDVAVTAFRKKAETLCEAEKTKFHELVIKSEQGYGSKASEAKEYADEEVTLIIDGYTSDFTLNHKTKSKLVIE